MGINASLLLGFAKGKIGVGSHVKDNPYEKDMYISNAYCIVMLSSKFLVREFTKSLCREAYRNGGFWCHSFLVWVQYLALAKLGFDKNFA